MKTNRGLTLIEIIVVIAILGMILVFGLIINLDSFKRNTFQSEQLILISVLQRARSRSLNNMFESSHGVCYIAPNYVIFRGNTCILSSTNQLIKANENITSISNSDFSNPIKFPTIVFDQLTGKTTNTTIHLTNGIKSADIIINNEGTINW